MKSVYFAHPSVGLKQVPDSYWPAIIPRTDSELGADWDQADDDVKDAAEQEFFSSLLCYFALRTTMTVRAELPDRSELERLRGGFAALDIEATVDDRDRTVDGPLLSAIVSSLVDLNPVRLSVSDGDEQLLSLHDSWTGVLVRLSEDEAAAVAKQLRRYQ